MSEAQAQVRIGDRQREAVDGRLRDALGEGVLTLAEYDERAGQCWAAVTQSELDVLTADLPAPTLLPVAPAPASGTTRRVLAVMSESDLASPVLPGDDVTATAVMGSAKVDLRRENLPSQLRVRATAVMGEIQVLVPPGTTVHLSGAAIAGERKVRTQPPSAGGPVVHVHATAVMGSVQVSDPPRAGGLAPATPGAAVHPPARRRTVRRRVVRGVLAAALVVGGGYGVTQVAAARDASALFGSARYDVQGQSDVQVGTAFGSVTVVVPDGVHVVVRGTVLFGSFDCRSACAGTGRVVVVEGGGAFGNVDVLTQSEARGR